MQLQCATLSRLFSFPAHIVLEHDSDASNKTVTALIASSRSISIHDASRPREFELELVRAAASAAHALSKGKWSKKCSKMCD